MDDMHNWNSIYLGERFNQCGFQKIVISTFGVSVAAFALAESGVLKGRNATTYHLDNGKTQKALAQYDVNIINEPVVVDKNIITSYCPETAPEVAFKLLEMLTDTEKMNQVKRAMGYN